MLRLSWLFPAHLKTDGHPDQPDEQPQRPHAKLLRRPRALSDASRSPAPSRSFSIRSLLPERRGSARTGAKPVRIEPTASPDAGPSSRPGQTPRSPLASTSSFDSPLVSTASTSSSSAGSSTSAAWTDDEPLVLSSNLSLRRRRRVVSIRTPPSSAPASVAPSRAPSLRGSPSLPSLRTAAAAAVEALPATPLARSERARPARTAATAAPPSIPPEFLAAGLPVDALRGASLGRRPAVMRAVEHVAEFVAEVGDWEDVRSAAASPILEAAPVFAAAPVVSSPVAAAKPLPLPLPLPPARSIRRGRTARRVGYRRRARSSRRLPGCRARSTSRRRPAFKFAGRARRRRLATRSSMSSSSLLSMRR